MRLQELMAQLGYLPMTFKATSGPAIGTTNAKARLAAAYRAPAGTFTWQSGWPWALRSQWKPGKANILQIGAVRAFESFPRRDTVVRAGELRRRLQERCRGAPELRHFDELHLHAARSLAEGQT